MPTAATETMAHLLHAATADADALLIALQAERDALEGRDPALLEQAVAAKSRLVAALEQHARARAEVTGSDPDTWFGQLDDQTGAALAGQRQQLRDTLTACQDLNGINGRIIARASQSTRELLGLMHGDSTATYNPTGNTGERRSSQSLARA